MIFVDYISEYTIPRKGKPDLTLPAVTMIDPVTGWFEVAPVQNKGADHIANLVSILLLSLCNDFVVT